MTEPQRKLLKVVIESEVAYWKARGDHELLLPRREVEVGAIAGVDPRTARSLVDAGLLTYAGSDNPHQTWVQLAYNGYTEKWE